MALPPSDPGSHSCNLSMPPSSVMALTQRRSLMWAPLFSRRALSLAPLFWAHMKLLLTSLKHPSSSVPTNTNAGLKMVSQWRPEDYGGSELQDNGIIFLASALILLKLDDFFIAVFLYFKCSLTSDHWAVWRRSEQPHGPFLCAQLAKLHSWPNKLFCIILVKVFSSVYALCSTKIQQDLFKLFKNIVIFETN